jgi:hypothetical protein
MLSTKKLITWIVDRSRELGIKLTPGDIVLECWLINLGNTPCAAAVSFSAREPFEGAK